GTDQARRGWGRRAPVRGVCCSLREGGFQRACCPLRPPASEHHCHALRDTERFRRTSGKRPRGESPEHRRNPRRATCVMETGYDELSLEPTHERFIGVAAF